VEYSAQSGGVTHCGEGSSSVRWEQGTCNARFKDEALKLGAAKEANGQKVEFCTVWICFLSSFFFFPFLFLPRVGKWVSDPTFFSFPQADKNACYDLV
jgi:hypothetical protein